jgi:hypothetical protein
MEKRGKESSRPVKRTRVSKPDPEDQARHSAVKMKKFIIYVSTHCYE